MFLRRRLALEEARRRGFEDGLSASETEPLDMSDSEKVTYQSARIRGLDAREHLLRGGQGRPRPYKT